MIPKLARLLRRLPLLLALQLPAGAAVLEGSAPREWPANPEKHQVVVRREAADAKLAAVIAAAEAVPPSGEAAEKTAGPDAVQPAGEKNWWYREELGIRIPRAVTADAVAYYRELVTTYGKQPFTRYAEPSSRLEYHAGAAFHASYRHGERTFANVHVVTLKLSFSQNFASTGTEGMHFDKHRTVVLDEQGRVLLILGDGPTEVPVLAI